jgi:hypothetical protein
VLLSHSGDDNLISHGILFIVVRHIDATYINIPLLRVKSKLTHHHLYSLGSFYINFGITGTEALLHPPLHPPLLKFMPENVGCLEKGLISSLLLFIL